MNKFVGLALMLPLMLVDVVAAEPDAAASGRVLLGDLNCVACHAAAFPSRAIAAKQGPRLADIGSRVSAGWLVRYLLAPHEAMPGTTMPDLLHGLPDAERGAAAEQLVHFLLAPRPVAFQPQVPDRAAVERGDKLYHRVGCVACHAPQDGAVLAGVPFPDLAEKWSCDGLRHFLLDPLATRPSGRMPAMGLSEREAGDIAQYLLRGTRIPAALEVEMHRGRMSSFEDIAGAELICSAATSGFSLEVAGRERDTALHFCGWLNVEQAGDYAFFLTGTGGTRIAIEGQWLAGNDTWDSEQVELRTTAHLEPGWHAIAVECFPRGRKDPSLLVEWEGPGITREAIPATRLRRTQAPVAEPARFVVDAAKAESGRLRYAQLGCASCHEATRAGVPAPALSVARSGTGCLADRVPAGLPDYRLDSVRREQLSAALAVLRAGDTEAQSPAQRVDQTMTAFRCYACHARDGHGGVTAARSAYFTSNAEDAGDEGRLPPTLDGIGDRLRPAWLATVLAMGVRIRPYLNARMPQFGAANVGHLAELFVTLDRQGQPPTPGSEPIDELREAGRKLVGTEGLSCIACHRFNRQPAHALQMLDLITVPERLNEDWFRRFLRDPNHFHPGTRMPMLWPGGMSLLPTVLKGSTDRQHAALWAYLSDGQKAKFPEGLSRTNMEIVIGGEPVIYRGKLWEAGYRGIAVGYPGAVNVAFDAEEMRLALLWRGRFLDASPHWSVAGMGLIHPLGGDVVVMPHGPATAQLADPAAPWPAESSRSLGFTFQGYWLDGQKRPTLRYALRGTIFEDRADPLPEGAITGLHRTLTATGDALPGLHLRVAVGRLESTGPQTWRLNQVLTVRVGPAEGAFVRGSGDHQELLLPLVFRDGSGRAEIDYQW